MTVLHYQPILGQERWIGIEAGATEPPAGLETVGPVCELCPTCGREMEPKEALFLGECCRCDDLRWSAVEFDYE